MKLLLALLALASLVLVAGCGGDGVGQSEDEAAIEQLVRDFVAAFEDEDPDAVLGMFAAECTGLEDELTAALDEFEFSFTLTGVEIRDLEADAAVAGPQGSVGVDGQESELSEADLHRVVKEDGEWKIGNCDFFDVSTRPTPTE